VVGSSRVSLPDGSGPSQRRSLQPAVQRSHDERCPSGSGWGNPCLSTPARAPARQGGVSSASRRPPLTRETSTGDVYGVRWGFGPTLRRDGAARAVWRDSDPCTTRRGSGGRAVVLAGCCGCRSRRAALGPGRKAAGLALWLTRSRVCAPWVKRRWKPVRGGESHEHASSESGGGLLVIPRADAQASGVLGGGSTRRWKTS